MTTTTTTTNRTAQTVANPAENDVTTQAPIADRVTEAGHETVDRVAATLSKQEEKLRANAEQAEEKLRQMTAKVQESTEAQTEQVKAYVKENPLASAGIAFAAGVLFSSILRK